MKKLLLHHASPHVFEFPDYKLLCANRTNHENGQLGLWVAPPSDWIGSFGEHVYALEVAGVMMDLSIKELSKWSAENREDPSFYIEIRDGLLARGIDYLRLVESNGVSAMGVVVNFQAIKSFSRLSPPLCVQSMEARKVAAMPTSKASLSHSSFAK